MTSDPHEQTPELELTPTEALEVDRTRAAARATAAARSTADDVAADGGPDTVLNAHTQGMIAVAMAVGLDRGAILRKAGLTEQELADPDGRHPIGKSHAMWCAIAELGPPDVGVRLGQAFRIENLGVVGYAISKCSVMSEAFACLERFGRIYHPTCFPLTSLEHDGVRIRCRAEPEWREVFVPVAMDVVSCLTAVRQLTGKHWRPVAVQLEPHPSSYDPTSLVRALDGNVQLHASSTQLLLPREVWNSPLVAPDPQLHLYLVRHAEALLAALPTSEALQERVRALVMDEVRAGDPTQARIAKKLGMGERTLQRRLKDEGTSFGDVVESVRSTLAQRYVSDQRLALAEVAFLLGYSEPSAFHRAFRRWTGSTPQAYRDRSLAAP